MGPHRRRPEPPVEEVALGLGRPGREAHGVVAPRRDAAALPGWLCAIARNAALDHVRRRARRGTAAPLEREPAAKGTPRDEGELRLRVLARVRELPDAYRETLVLRLVEGLTGPEIAARTGLGAASVRVNLCRGMALLRPLLREEGWP